MYGRCSPVASPRYLPQPCTTRLEVTIRCPKSDSEGYATGYMATYALLRKAGNNGVQMPIKQVDGDKLLGSPTLYPDDKFDTPNGKIQVFPAKWDGWLKQAAEVKAKYKFWINNGRFNEVWQSWYNNQYDPFIMDRYPMTVIQMNPSDMATLGVEPTREPGPTFVGSARCPTGNVRSRPRAACTGFESPLFPQAEMAWGNRCPPPRAAVPWAPTLEPIF